MGRGGLRPGADARRTPTRSATDVCPAGSGTVAGGLLSAVLRSGVRRRFVGVPALRRGVDPAPPRPPRLHPPAQGQHLLGLRPVLRVSGIGSIESRGRVAPFLRNPGRGPLRNDRRHVRQRAVSIPRLSWRASKLRFDSPLAVTFTFSDRGGYVALAKHYQRHFKRWGYYKTLEQKAAENATVRQMAGEAVFWIHGRLPTTSWPSPG